jgi:hypothetical protein
MMELVGFSANERVSLVTFHSVELFETGQQPAENLFEDC